MIVMIVLLGVSLGFVNGQENLRTTVVLVAEEIVLQGSEAVTQVLAKAGLPDYLSVEIAQKVILTSANTFNNRNLSAQTNTVFIHGKQLNCAPVRDAFALWQMGVGLFTSGWTSSLKIIVTSGTSTSPNFYAIAYADITQDYERILSHSLYVSSTYVHGYNAWCL